MANDNIIEKLDIEATVMANAQEAMRILQELIERAEQHTERYDLSWVGKARAFAEAGMPINKTLRPDIEESVNFDETENLFITGDNLDALKLLQESYLGKVDVIYIDPPYNTGKDFVYHDKFSKTFEKAKEESKDDEGFRLYTVNSSDNGRYHSDWLSMMYPRLRIARNFLSESGVIFISIDDNEQANLKWICGEVFGENNFVAQIVWERAYAPVNLKKHFSESHDYIVCFSKNIDLLECYGLTRTDNANDRYSNPDNDKRGVWKSGDFSVGPQVEKNVYEIITPSGRKVLPPSGRSWRVTQERYFELKNNNRIWFGENGDNVPSTKQFLSEVKQGITPMTIWKYSEVGHSQDAAKKLKELFDGNMYFEYPKSVDLIKRMLELYSKEKKSALILDFFAGSGTTAHAVMKLNAEDGGNRKWILVQLDEATAENSEARKAGYMTIDAIARERIRRAEKSLYKDTSTSLSASSEKNKRDSQDLFADENLGNPGNLGKIPVENPGQIKVGFRALRVDTNNINDGILKSPAETKQDDLFLAVDNIKRERTPLDLLFGTLTSLALELNKPLRVVKKEIPAYAGMTGAQTSAFARMTGATENAGMTGATVSQTLYVYDYFGELSGLVACFDDVVSEEAVKEIARMRPLAAVFRDSSFATAAEKVNLSEHFRTLSPETKVKVI